MGEQWPLSRGVQLQADGKAAPDPSAEPVTEQAITKEDAGASRVGIKKQKIIIAQSAIGIQQDGKTRPAGRLVCCGETDVCLP